MHTRDQSLQREARSRGCRWSAADRWASESWSYNSADSSKGKPDCCSTRRAYVVTPASTIHTTWTRRVSLRAVLLRAAVIWQVCCRPRSRCLLCQGSLRWRVVPTRGRCTALCNRSFHLISNWPTWIIMVDRQHLLVLANDCPDVSNQSGQRCT